MDLTIINVIYLEKFLELWDESITFKYQTRKGA